MFDALPVIFHFVIAVQPLAEEYHSERHELGTVEVEGIVLQLRCDEAEYENLKQDGFSSSNKIVPTQLNQIQICSYRSIAFGLRKFKGNNKNRGLKLQNICLCLIFVTTFSF